MKKITSMILTAGSAFVISCSSDPSISILPSTDNFQQQGNEIVAKMDILWVIDNSGSMSNEQEDLRNNFNSFITSFAGKGYDYRMAVITTDAYYTELGTYTTAGGYDMSTEQTGPYSNFVFNNFDNSVKCPGSAVVTSSFVDGDLTAGGAAQSGYVMISSEDASIDFSIYDPASPEYDPAAPEYIPNNVKNIFAINSKVGLQGCYWESGLKSTITALQDSANTGFPRADAHLAIIVVSDEQDAKIGSNLGTDPVSGFHTTLEGIASSAYGYSFHTIAILGEGGDNYCGTGSSSRVGSRYIELSQLSDGIQASICGDFATALEDIAQTIIEKTVEFKLSDVPADPNGLVVQVKNLGESEFSIIPKDINNGWTYNSVANSIIFHGTGIPAQGAELSIYYDPDSL